MVCDLRIGSSCPEPDGQASPERGIFPGRTLYLAAARDVSLRGWSCIFSRLALYLPHLCQSLCASAVHPYRGRSSPLS